MLYYPQLTTGSLTHYPISRRNHRRTVTNVLADGSDIREEDPGAAQALWDLSYAHVTPSEFTSIEQLFDAVEGRLMTFTFLDPTDNLLKWSEDLTHSTWTVDPLLQIAGGIQDVLGSTGGAQLTNTAQAVQQVGQTIAAPSWFQYCFSAYLRSDAPCTVQMIASSQSGQVRQAFEVGSVWARAVAPIHLASQDDGIHFGLELPAGCTVTIFGPQVEAQLGAGPYKKTTDMAGVYAKSRFDSDGLMWTATGPQQYSCSVRINSCTAG
ncbi:MAG: phage head spike fiber domain-containing protein [Bryobacteraceae bacterium]